jgi:hypothetical protein
VTYRLLRMLYVAPTNEEVRRARSDLGGCSSAPVTLEKRNFASAAPMSAGADGLDTAVPAPIGTSLSLAPPR